MTILPNETFKCDFTGRIPLYINLPDHRISNDI